MPTIKSIDDCLFEADTPDVQYRVDSLGEEKEFLRLFLSGIKPGDIVFDIGSCVGLFALPAAKLGAKVYAFEPSPYFAGILGKNIQLNHLDDSVQIVRWGVGEAQEIRALYIEDDRSPSLSADVGGKHILIEVNSIDRAIESGELPAPNVIKMDIEGSEILALRGMRGLLTECEELLLFIEIHPDLLKSFDASEADIHQLLESHGFERGHCASRNNQIHCTYRKCKGGEG